VFCTCYILRNRYQHYEFCRYCKRAKDLQRKYKSFALAYICKDIKRKANDILRNTYIYLCSKNQLYALFIFSLFRQSTGLGWNGSSIPARPIDS